MSVSNIRGVLDFSPDSGHGSKQHHVENIMRNHPLLISPSTSKKYFEIPDQTNTDSSTSSAFVTAGFPTTHLLQEVPNNNNTVVTIISMGRLVDRFNLERCIRSLRVRGKFTGYVLVFTDDIGHRTYQHSMSWDLKTKVIRGWEEDMQPMENVTVIVTMENGKQRIETRRKEKVYAQDTMVFKRFKTLHSKYITADPDFASSNIRYVLYVDVDNIIGNSLQGFFRDYVDMIQKEFELWQVNLTIHNQRDNVGFISMFRDRHLKDKMHSGIVLFDLMFEDRCTNAWRKEMDQFHHVSDQVMLLNVIGNYTAYQCRTFALPYRKHFNFASKRIMEERKAKNLPTFVHITEFRVRRLNNPTLHQDFLRFVLDLKENETMGDYTTWEYAISPTASRAQWESRA
jgi:hypothetical protein